MCLAQLRASHHRIYITDHKEITTLSLCMCEPKNGKVLQPIKGPCCRLVTHLPNGTLIVMMINLERIAFASPAVSDNPVGSLANWLD